MRALLLALTLAGCATGARTGQDPDQAALERELAGRNAGPASRCAPARPAQNLRAAGGWAFVLEDGETLWVSRPRQRCSGFGPLSTLVVDRQGSEYCRGDRLRGLEPGTSIPGPVCVLGDFMPYRRPL